MTEREQQTILLAEKGTPVQPNKESTLPGAAPQGNQESSYGPPSGAGASPRNEETVSPGLSYLVVPAIDYCLVPKCGPVAVTASMDPAEIEKPMADEEKSHDLMMEVQSQISTVLEMHDFEPCGAIKVAQEATKKAWDVWDRQAGQIADLKAQVERLTQELAVRPTEAEYATAVNAALAETERAEKAEAAAITAKREQFPMQALIAKLTGERDAAKLDTARLDWLFRAIYRDVINLPFDREGVDATIAKEPADKP